ncbi:MAG: YjbF family lipoprotein [Pseudomonadota bacterium]
MQFYQALRQGVAASFGSARITKAQASAIAYASMGYRLNSGAEQIVVLATDANGEQLWTSAAHIVILTHGGRITRTVGLEHDVSGVTPKAGQQLPDIAAAFKGTVTYTRMEDFLDIPAYGVALVCTLSRRGAQTVLILGHAIATIRIDETCRGVDLKWSFTDSYWADPDTGFVWRSHQHINPKGSVIDTEILRPPG